MAAAWHLLQAGDLRERCLGYPAHDIRPKVSPT